MMSGAVGRVALRAQMVSLSARGFSAPEIAQIHDCAEATVYKWIDRFDKEGPSGLYDREREGRSPKIDEEAEEELKRLLETTPPEEGENASRWKMPLDGRRPGWPATWRRPSALRCIQKQCAGPCGVLDLAGLVRAASCLRPTEKNTRGAWPRLSRQLRR